MNYPFLRPSLALYLESLLANKKNYQEVDTFCLFLGYQRSGHSLVGAIIDAHPQAIMAHELNALEFLRKGYSKKQLFYLLEKQSLQFAQSTYQWQGYSYHIPGMWQGKHTQLKLIGDKRGATTLKVIKNNPDLLDQAARFCPNFKLIHVIRNPFDCISTRIKRREVKKKRTFTDEGIKKKIDNFFAQATLIQELKRSTKNELWDIRFEEMVCHPKREIHRLYDFLGLECKEEYIGKCAKIIHSSPNQSRFKATFWTEELKADVQQKMASFDFLSTYRFAP